MSEVEVTLQRCYSGRDAVDPHFGMPLFLIHGSRLGAVWAYNERHLSELIAYVQATLRVRQCAGNRSMFSRLPAWMKLAKNRGSVLKSLQKLGTLSAKDASCRKPPDSRHIEPSRT